MPVVVDKEKIKKDILDAFQQCIRTKALGTITLRDIAAQAGMSHQKLLTYFSTKDELVTTYCTYTKEYMIDHCRSWFTHNLRENYTSNCDYMNAFMKYVLNGPADEIRPNATVQTYVLAHYNPDIKKIVAEEFTAWRKVMTQCLTAIYGTEAGEKEAEVMMILITGAFTCNYTGALTGKIDDNVIGCLSNLAKS